MPMGYEPDDVPEDDDYEEDDEGTCAACGGSGTVCDACGEGSNDCDCSDMTTRVDVGCPTCGGSGVL